MLLAAVNLYCWGSRLKYICRLYTQSLPLIDLSETYGVPLQRNMRMQLDRTMQYRHRLSPTSAFFISDITAASIMINQ